MAFLFVIQLMQMNPVLIYCYDAYCGWCYGFSPVIQKIASVFQNTMPIEVLSGGMVLPAAPTPVAVMAGYIRKAYKTVERKTGVPFGKDYLWHIYHPEESDWFPNSEKPAIALSIFKEYRPGLQVPFAADLQYSHHYEGRDLTDDETYRNLLLKYEIPAQPFYSKLHGKEYSEKAYDEFSVVKQLKVTGFPTVMIQEDASKFHLVARGYTPYDTLKSNIIQALQSITSSSSS